MDVTDEQWYVLEPLIGGLPSRVLQRFLCVFCISDTDGGTLHGNYFCGYLCRVLAQAAVVCTASDNGVGCMSNAC